MIGEKYDHARYAGRRRVLNWLLHQVGFRFLIKVDHVEGLENVPAEGPAILMINHIALIDPVLVLGLVARQITPMAKIEVYSYPVIGILPRLWEVIPVRRGEVDRRAIRQALQVLEAGEIVLVAPEGTRHPHLQKAREGIAYLGRRTNAPVIPVAVDGTIGLPALRGTARWRGPGGVVRFGRGFRFLRPPTGTKDDLRLMTQEAMYVLAGMLEPERRGHYSDLGLGTTETLEFI
jgi:1-acyl-sn-glycerol-3-phosphate acyltransferase